MPTIDDLGQSNYLTKSDCVPDITVTIAGYELKNLAKDGKPAENKYCLNFAGDTKPMVLNKVNGELIAMCLGSKDFDAWIGKQITLWHDPTVSFAGEMKGGIRVRYIPPQQSPPPSQPTQGNVNPPRTDETGPLPTEPDGIPF